MKMLLILLLGGCGVVWADETIDLISIPTSASFFVTDITQQTTGSNATIEYADGNLLAGRRLQISLKANSATFTAGSGTAIPADKVSWDGAFPGTLSALSYTRVYLSPQNPISDTHSFMWTLDALDDLPALRAGNQTLTATWKIESTI